MLPQSGLLLLLHIEELGKTPETPLLACSRTSCENASSELSPLSNSATSIGLAGSSSTAPVGHL